MKHPKASINPFYAARKHLPRSAAVYARLPRAPINGSPVPHLTSLYHHDEAGDYGGRGYPDLSPRQAWKVLQSGERSHDATIGIDWDALACHAEMLYGFAEFEGDDHD